MSIKNKASSLLDEFKAFAFKGNIVDMAIGVIIGGAFGKIVSSFVSSLVMPLVTALIAGITNKEDAGEGLKELAITLNGVAIPYGEFLGQVLDFFIVAIVVFLVMKKFLGFMQNMRKKEEAAAAPEAPAEPPPPPPEQVLLTEIRDLLKQQNEAK